MLHTQNEAAVTVLHEAFDSFRKHCAKVLPAALCFVWRRNPSLWARFEFYHKTKCKAVDETLPGCQPHTSSNKENMTSPSSNIKAPYRGVASSPNLRGEEIKQYQKQHSTFQIFLSVSQVYDKSSIIWETTDINMEQSGDREIRLKIWRLQT